MKLSDVLDVFIADNCEDVSPVRWQRFKYLHGAINSYSRKYTDLDGIAAHELLDYLADSPYRVDHIPHRGEMTTVIYGLHVTDRDFIEPEWSN